MRLSKIHRVLKFKQSNWLEEYIKFNTEQRKEATDKIQLNFLKIKQHLWQNNGKY